jgi:hypothetical protein
MTTDVITRGVERSTGKPPFESSAPPPPPAENDPIDVVSRGVPDAISGSSDEERVRASVDALNEKRRKEWESGIGDDPFAEQRNVVDVELKYDSRDHKPKTLRQTAKDVSDRHLLERPEAQFVRQQFGMTDEQILWITKNEDYLRSLGYTNEQAARYARTGEVPPMKLIATRDDGSLIRPLDDDAPVTEADAFRSRSELKRGVRNFRQATVEAQQKLLAELAAQQEQPAADQVASAEQASAIERAPQQAPSEPAQPTPQQNDPLAAERQQLAVERDAYARARQGSAAEEQADQQIKAWNAALLRQFPEAANKAAIEELTRTNPARAQQLAQAARKTADAVAGWMQKGLAATQARTANENALAQLQHAHARAAWHSYKQQNDNLAQERIAELRDPKQSGAFRNATRAALKDLGFSDNELSAAWDGHTGFSLRDFRVQAMIADGVRWRQAQARAKTVTKAPIPEVLRPGTFRPRGAGNEEQIARLERELEGATGARALRLGTKLHQLRRAG